ncbi:MAG: hypothetical protein QOH36_1953 [Actinomycetota bacterium]|nr:hypothetical protein [Actinomycetota bacterium]
MNVRSRPWAAVAGLSIALAASFTACGGDDDESAADVTAACEAHANVLAGFNTLFTVVPEPPEDGPPPPEFKGQLQSAYDANIAAPVAQLVSSAPDEIKDEVDEIALKVKQFRDDADPSAIDGDDFERLTGTVDAYLHENCSGPKADVKAVNYGYQGLPATLPSGTVRIKLDNSTDEAHEIVILNRKPGVTETYDQLLALPDDQAQAKLDFVDATSTDPGGTGYIVANLPAGDLVFMCSFGKGSTDDDDPKQEEPHFTLGMKQEVKVA